MSQFFLLPCWICESRDRPDGRQHDYHITQMKITNPSDVDGRFELVVYEARGDGNFYRSEWGSGRWAAPRKWQRAFRLDPSAAFGTSFYTYGWAELWLSNSQMTADVSITSIVRPENELFPVLSSTREVSLVPQKPPYYNVFIEGFLRLSVSPLKFPTGTKVVSPDRSMFDLRDSFESMSGIPRDGKA